MLERPSEDEDISLMRLKDFNDDIVNRFKALESTPLQDLNLKNSKGHLSPKEKQLDTELANFLRKFTKLNNSIDTDDNVNSSSNNVVKPIRGREFPFLEPSASVKPYTEQELFLRQLNHSSHVAKLGANISNVYFPSNDIHKPVSPQELSIAKLMAAGVHLGQSTALWRASTQPYIYGEYKGIHIIDLNKTLSHLKRAAKVVEGIAERGGIILFLGTRQGQKRGLEEAAKRTHGYYVSSRWIPGTLTNPTEISNVWERHEVDFFDTPTGRELTQNEQISIVKPDLLVVLNPTENRNALNEAMQARVPTIGIIDTDSEPSFVTYPIPGNDDSLRSVNLILGVLAKAGERGLENRLLKAKAAENAVESDVTIETEAIA
ncbi:hypothetical protein Kpol_1018p50 [Vanderwaltozyma polyspora DSM 70294]|uniref:Ribosomal protein S2 n=1 Tax=Vanderwaltozyma polyspora (strain ATCC 22028 / DSM 70294 / BCRC 21397 / CBS 2163 / NBRC 10782 / NRRL Y-8283 / UCD 57-17) TaxID=436907 RepID=A7TDP9_VANPO|nr:uncharacterized protein Kpol_1018p50 [Vanderwaltozyma polyspora DSM 70294]EDO19519.1 hypothetical protein Kpol_1018p50 [Vanderwaltozyma polyspora DSM 70294]